MPFQKSASLLMFVSMMLMCAGVDARQLVLFDYSDRSFREDEPATRAPQQLTTALIEAGIETVLEAGRDRIASELVTLGQAIGAFTAPGRTQRVVLVSLGKPIAAVPFPADQAQALVVLEADRIVAIHAVPAERHYARLIDPDIPTGGLTPIWLEGRFFNMDELVISLDRLRLNGAGGSVVEGHHPEVYFDACSSTGEHRAGTLTFHPSADQSYTLKMEDLPCTADP